MNTLIVSYLPSGERSNTKQLLDALLTRIPAINMERLDLLQDVPDMFDELRLSAYIDRNYQNKTLSAEQQNAIQKMDRMTAQLKSADIVVIAYPMHNFSMPAMIKAYFDSVMQKGVTWSIGSKGFEGLMKGKKALVLTSSGGVYEGPMVSWEHSTTLAKTEFSFMGFSDVRVISAAGLNMDPQKTDQIIDDAKKQLRVAIK
ncbi:MAG TPA: NAD(P)H-dependent oxidoreductase, partial [bacterium]|nr:NAD(P)H-dependent oxidoreductase [bacterium]